MKRILILAALALVGALAAPAVQAEDFNQSVSGNFLDTSIDVNNDGMAGAMIMADAKGSGGGSFRGYQEVMFVAPTGLCDPTEAEVVFVAYSIVRRFANGDLLFSNLVDGTSCLDPVSGLASVVVNAEFIGGTGRFANATGGYTLEYDAVVLLPDFGGGIAHGAFVGTVDGTLD